MTLDENALSGSRPPGPPPPCALLPASAVRPQRTSAPPRSPCGWPPAPRESSRAPRQPVLFRPACGPRLLAPPPIVQRPAGPRDPAATARARGRPPPAWRAGLPRLAARRRPGPPLPPRASPHPSAPAPGARRSPRRARRALPGACARFPGAPLRRRCAPPRGTVPCGPRLRRPGPSARRAGSPSSRSTCFPRPEDGRLPRRIHERPAGRRWRFSRPAPPGALPRSRAAPGRPSTRLRERRPRSEGASGLFSFAHLAHGFRDCSRICRVFISSSSASRRRDAASLLSLSAFA